MGRSQIWNTIAAPKLKVLQYDNKMNDVNMLSLWELRIIEMKLMQ